MGLFHVVAFEVGPGVEFFQDPGGNTHGAVGHGVAQGLGLGGLLGSVAIFHDLVAFQLGLPFNFFRGLGTVHVAHAGAVDVDGFTGRGVIVAQPVTNHRTPVTALGQVGFVSQHFGHQLIDDLSHFTGTHGTGGTAGETETGQGRCDDVKGVFFVAAETFRVGQFFDDVQEFHNGSGPAVADHQGGGVGSAALFMDEVHFNTVHLSLELGELVDFGFVFAPVVFLDPVVAEFLQVIDVGAVVPASVIGPVLPGVIGYPFFDVRQGFFGHIYFEGFNHRSDSSIKYKVFAGPGISRENRFQKPVPQGTEECIFQDCQGGHSVSLPQMGSIHQPPLANKIKPGKASHGMP